MHAGALACMPVKQATTKLAAAATEPQNPDAGKRPFMRRMHAAPLHLLEEVVLELAGLVARGGELRLLGPQLVCTPPTPLLRVTF